MGNPFSGASGGGGVGSYLSNVGSNIASLPTPIQQGGSLNGMGAGGSGGLMNLFQQLTSQQGTKAPGLYTPPDVLSQSQIATTSPSQMNEMQPPTFNPAWSTNTDPFGSISGASTSTPAWGQPTS
jgi:hypothetical protein